MRQGKAKMYKKFLRIGLSSSAEPGLEAADERPFHEVNQLNIGA